MTTDIRAMKILIVDDHQTMRNVVSNLLQRLGFQNIDEAADGTEALKILRANSQYGLIITDWNMKPMSGLQLLHKAQADPDLKNIPFIIITAESKAENVIAAKEAGVSNYIVKPFDENTLKAKMINIFGYFK